MKKWFYVPSVFLAAIVVWLWPDATGRYPLPFGFYLGQVFQETIKPEDLIANYEQSRLKILLVPGHDNEFNGAEFGAIKESQLTLRFSKLLYDHLKNDSRFIVYTTRDWPSGDYESSLGNYLVANRAAINSFRVKLREQLLGLIGAGQFTEKTIVSHNFATEEVAARLYGINKWANDNKIDLTFHIHFNDYPGRPWRRPGDHLGFSIYVPEKQLPNSRTSQALAAELFKILSRTVPVSTLPGESAGVVEDQELIAVGSYGSREGAALLVEYGYIYEPQVVNNQAVREKYLAELAWLTYRGLKTYFEPSIDLAPSAIVPSYFSFNLNEGLRGSPDVFLLQRVLQLAEFYPPTGRGLTDCPLTGNFGPCVRQAVINFQTANDLPPTGTVGELTRGRLNTLSL